MKEENSQRIIVNSLTEIRKSLEEIRMLLITGLFEPIGEGEESDGKFSKELSIPKKEDEDIEPEEPEPFTLKYLGYLG